jgi:CRP-like cAMP-binding protein
MATIYKGDFFGEMSLLTGEDRSATVKALEDTTVMRVDKELFSIFLASNPDICEQLGAVMAQRQQDFSQDAIKAQTKLSLQLKLIAKIKAFFGV